MGALVFGIVEAAEAGWAAPATAPSLALGVALLAGFVWLESRAPQPLLPLSLLTDRQRNGAYGARFLFLCGMTGFWFFTAQVLQGALGFTPLQAGLAFVPVTLPQLASSLSVPAVGRRLGQRRMLLSGLALCAVGLLWQGLAAPQMDYLGGMVGPMALIGLGQGWVLAPLTVAGVAGVAPRAVGAASGVLNVAHQLGASLGLALLVLAYTAGAVPAHTAQGMAEHTGQVLQVSALFVVAALAVAVRFVLTTRADGAEGVAAPGPGPTASSVPAEP